MSNRGDEVVTSFLSVYYNDMVIYYLDESMKPWIIGLSSRTFQNRVC